MAEKYVNNAEAAAKNLQDSRMEFHNSVKEILIGLKTKSTLTQEDKNLLRRITEILNTQLNQVANYDKNLKEVQEEAQQIQSRFVK
jgi:hypothetical protein